MGQILVSREIAQCGKTLFSIFQQFSAGIGALLVWGEGWALIYNSILKRDLKSFGNS